MHSIGIDMGGTFTDFVSYDPQKGQIRLDKIPTHKTTPWKPIIEYLHHTAPPGQDIADIRHGTTVGVNAVIERTRSRAGLLTTEGFRDILEIGRQKRPRLYDLRMSAAPPLIPRNLRLVVKERMSAQGKILTSLDKQGLAEAAELFKTNGVQSIAILFLHAYINNVHERKAAAFLKKALPGVFVTTSSEVIAQFREYERLSTTAVNAYLKPVMVAYLEKLFQKLQEMALKTPFYISQSDGGITSAQTAIQLPVRTLYSGPSAGVVGCAAFYGKQGRDLISLDMGGTSTDLALISGQQPVTTTEKTAAGYPILFPAIDLKTVGAGGGSIAQIDQGGFLQVGPASAKADPGPACYGKGGQRPTVTDANLILGMLGPYTMLGGKMTMDKAKAVQATEQHICRHLGRSVSKSAEAIIRLAVSNIANAIRNISILTGIHPQELTLAAYGGSGPMHAADIARELGISEVIIPPNPGVFSALGLLCSNLTMDFVNTVQGLSVQKIAAVADALHQKGHRWFAREKIAASIQKMQWSADLRYKGQNYEINIKLAPDTFQKGIGIDSLTQRFHQKHIQRYGHCQEEQEVEIVNLRLKCLGLVSASVRPQGIEGKHRGKSQQERMVTFLGWDQPLSTPVLSKSLACRQKKLMGPVIIEEMDATIVIGPRDQGTIGPHGELLIKVGAN